MAGVDLKEKALTLLSTTSVSVVTAGATTLYTVPTGKRCVLHSAILVHNSAGVTSVTGQVTIGQVGALTDFVGTQTLTNLAAQYDAVIVQPVPHASVPVKTKCYAAGTIIQMNVSTADTDGPTVLVMLYGTLYDA